MATATTVVGSEGQLAARPHQVLACSSSANNNNEEANTSGNNKGRLIHSQQGGSGGGNVGRLLWMFLPSHRKNNTNHHLVQDQVGEVERSTTEPLTASLSASAATSRGGGGAGAEAASLHHPHHPVEDQDDAPTVLSRNTTTSTSTGVRRQPQQPQPTNNKNNDHHVVRRALHKVHKRVVDRQQRQQRRGNSSRHRGSTRRQPRRQPRSRRRVSFAATSLPSSSSHLQVGNNNNEQQEESLLTRPSSSFAGVPPYVPPDDDNHQLNNNNAPSYDGIPTRHDIRRAPSCPATGGIECDGDTRHTPSEALPALSSSSIRAPTAAAAAATTTTTTITTTGAVMDDRNFEPTSKASARIQQCEAGAAISNDASATEDGHLSSSPSQTHYGEFPVWQAHAMEAKIMDPPPRSPPPTASDTVNGVNANDGNINDGPMTAIPLVHARLSDDGTELNSHRMSLSSPDGGRSHRSSSSNRSRSYATTRLVTSSRRGSSSGSSSLGRRSSHRSSSSSSSSAIQSLRTMVRGRASSPAGRRFEGDPLPQEHFQLLESRTRPLRPTSLRPPDPVCASATTARDCSESSCVDSSRSAVADSSEQQRRQPEARLAGSPPQVPQASCGVDQNYQQQILNKLDEHSNILIRLCARMDRMDEKNTSALADISGRVDAMHSEVKRTQAGGFHASTMATNMTALNQHARGSDPPEQNAFEPEEADDDDCCRIIKIQACARRFLSHRKFQRVLQGIVSLQAFCRCYLQHADFQRKRCGVVQIQATVRGRIACSHVNSILQSIVRFQAIIRGQAFRDCMARRRSVAIVLQHAVRTRQTTPSRINAILRKAGLRNVLAKHPTLTSKDTMLRKDSLQIVVVSTSTKTNPFLSKVLRSSPGSCKQNAVGFIEWVPACIGDCSPPITFLVKDAIRQQAAGSNCSNFWANPTTQSLSFANHSVYLLFHDCRVSGSESENIQIGQDGQGEHCINANAHRILLLFDQIAKTAPKSIVLPVLQLSEDACSSDIQHLSKAVTRLLDDHLGRCSLQAKNMPKIVKNGQCGMSVLRKGNHEDLRHLEEKIVNLAKDPLLRDFHRIGGRVPTGTAAVLGALTEFRHQSNKMCFLEDLLDAIQPKLNSDTVTNALTFLTTVGEVLYFGNKGRSNSLKQVIVLSESWLRSSLLIATAKRFNSWRQLADDCSGDNYPILHSLAKCCTSECPLVSIAEIEAKWKSWHSLGKSPEVERRESILLGFLKSVMFEFGLVRPLRCQSDDTLLSSDVVYTPGMIRRAAACNQWTYKPDCSYTTVLCHAFLFRNCVACNLMEHLMPVLLARLATWDTTQPSPGVFCDESSILLVFEHCRFYVALPDKSTQSTSSHMQHVFVSAKGNAGAHGIPLWNGGYRTILAAIERALSGFSGFEFYAVCPQCLESACPLLAHKWDWKHVTAAATRENPFIFCASKHQNDSRLLYGTCPVTDLTMNPTHSVIDVEPFLNGCVQIAVLNRGLDGTFELASFGSGFIYDVDRGLVGSAAHIVFDLKERFGQQRGSVVMIGVIPDPKQAKYATFRYLAQVIKHDVGNMDACVLRVTGRLDRDIENPEDLVGLTSIASSPVSLPLEGLRSLSQTTSFHLNENVWILGFNQAERGMVEVVREHKLQKMFCRSANVVRGYISRDWKRSDDSVAFSWCSKTSQSCTPRRELILGDCPTMSGDSGGACINCRGELVGILSMGDSKRSYVVPTSEFQLLTESESVRRYA